MPNLPAATDPVRMAGVLLGLQDETADILSVSRRLSIDTVRYVPEVGAILHYKIDTDAAKLNVFARCSQAIAGCAHIELVGRPLAGLEAVPRLSEPPAAPGLRGGFRAPAGRTCAG